MPEDFNSIPMVQPVLRGQQPQQTYIPSIETAQVLTPAQIQMTPGHEYPPLEANTAPDPMVQQLQRNPGPLQAGLVRESTPGFVTDHNHDDPVQRHLMAEAGRAMTARPPEEIFGFLNGRPHPQQPAVVKATQEWKEAQGFYRNYPIKK